MRQHKLLCLLAAAALLVATAAPAQTIGPNLNLTKAAGNQYEAAVAINPGNSNQVFIASRNEVGGLYTARSGDGGVTWTSQLIARTTTPAAGDIPRAYGNASVAWDAFGNLFLAYISQSSIGAGTYVSLALSKDGGATFFSPAGSGPAITLPINTPGQLVAGDRPTVRVGPGSAGYTGSVWVTYWTQGGIVVSGAGVSALGIVGPFTTFQPPQPPSVNFGDVAVGPNGEVVVTYGPNAGTSGAIYSNLKPDGLGTGSFSAYSTVVPVNMGGFTHLPAQPNWGVDPEPRLAWDRSGGPHQGRLYLSYTNTPSVGSADTNIFVIHSDDMGTTWSAPVRVNDDTGTNSQFLPSIALDQTNGAIAVTWYDARDSALNDTARYYGAFSSDGTAFSPNFAISTGTSNQANSPAAVNINKTDYGDYTGNAFANGRLVPAWADNSNSTGDNPNGATSFDVYTAIVQAPTATSSPAQTVTFDFDTGSPLLAIRQNTPFDQTAGGVTAHFSSPQGPAFSVQSDSSTGFSMSKFSGKYLNDNNLNRNVLSIQFSSPLTRISLAFATADFHQVEIPTTLQLTAYLGSDTSPAVGSTTAHGTYASDTMPMGALSFDSGGLPFDLVELVALPQGAGTADFLVDNIVVTPVSTAMSLTSVNNAASYAASSIAPGEIVTLFGSNLGPAALTMATFDATNRLPVTLGGVRVLFNGTPAPLVYVGDKTIAAIVPFGVGAGTGAQVQVEYNGQISNALTASVANTMPGLYSADSSGSGQGAITYQDGSPNSPQNPAAAGSVVTLWASGLGALIPQPADGALVTGQTLPVLQYPVSVTIGGQPVQILYQGPAPMAVAGLYQINCLVPVGLSPGPAPVVITSDGRQSQPNLTIALQ